MQFQKNKSMSRASSPTPQLLTAMNLHVDQSSFDVDRPHTAPPGNRMQSSEIEVCFYVFFLNMPVIVLLFFAL